MFDLAAVIFFAAFPLSVRHLWLCKGISFFGLFSSKISRLILTLIAIQRFMYIVPQPSRILTIRQLRILLTVAILLGIALTIPEVIFFEISEYTSSFRNQSSTLKRCTINHVYSRKIVRIVIFVATFLNMFAICVLYAVIGKAIVKRLKKSDKTQHTDKSTQEITQENEREVNNENIEMEHKRDAMLSRMNSKESNGASKSADTNRESSMEGRQKTKLRHSPRSTEAKSRFTFMFLIIIVFYILSYLPVHFYGLITLVNFDETPEKAIQEWEVGTRLIVFSILNHIVNPFVYGYFDTLFKQECKTMFCRKRC